MYKNKNIVRDGPFFTHFACLPFRRPLQTQTVAHLQQHLRTVLQRHPKYAPDCLKEHPPALAHLTLFKLILRHTATQQKTVRLLEPFEAELRGLLGQRPVRLSSIGYFTRFNKNAKCREVTVVYLQPEEEMASALGRVVDGALRALLAEEVVAPEELKDMNVLYDHHSNMYKPETFHVSLFRARNLLEDEQLSELWAELQEGFKGVEFGCDSFDISTMREFESEGGFYLPLHRGALSD